MELIPLKTVPSTNTWIKEHLKELQRRAPLGVYAEEQTAGRGRGKNSWFSPQGKNLYASFLFLRVTTYPHLSYLAHILSLAAADLCEAEKVEVQLKWPNDLLIEGKKLGGVLVETLSLEGRLALIFGIGINLNSSEEELSCLNQKATSLTEATKTLHSIPSFAARLGKKLSENLLILDRLGFAPFLPHYERLLIPRLGDPLRCQLGENTVEGSYCGLNSQGHLLLNTGSHVITVVTAQNLESPLKRDGF